MKRLILASASPQRKTLLEGLHLLFEVIPSTIEEDKHPEKDPMKRSKDLAKLKALDVARIHPDAIVIGCDTLVVASDGTLLEKPSSPEEARTMIKKQSDTLSVVHSALCIVDANNIHEDVSTSSVRFKKLSTEDIEWWVSTKLWEGRSGGFQIDGLGQLMISHIDGDWTGIVGLPVYLLGKLLEKAGLNLSSKR